MTGAPFYGAPFQKGTTMNRQTRIPLFSALKINVEAIEQEFDYLTDEQAREVAEVFLGYLTDYGSSDVFDTLAIIAEDVSARW